MKQTSLTSFSRYYVVDNTEIGHSRENRKYELNGNIYARYIVSMLSIKKDKVLK